MIDNELAVIERVRDRTYLARIERVIGVDVKAWDRNCHQQALKLVEQQHLRQLVAVATREWRASAPL